MSPLSQKKAKLACSELELQAEAVALARQLKPGDRVLLEGEMGTGKSTFARWILESLQTHSLSEGSPTFSIAHEYKTSRGDLVHIDFYRLKSLSEIEEAGLPSYFWERQAIVLTEWLSLWPDFEKSVLLQKPLTSDESPRTFWRVFLKVCEGSSTQRDYQMESQALLF